MKTKATREELYKLYWKEEYSLAEIENKLNYVSSTLTRTFKKLGIKIRTLKEASNTERCKRKNIIRNTGRNHPKWKGGIYRDGDGYIRIKKFNHPRADIQGYVRRSHLVAEQTLGRYLYSNEITHHKNETRDDDRPENIEVTKRAEHMAFHHTKRKLIYKH
jgi:predicted chitinase